MCREEKGLSFEIQFLEVNHIPNFMHLGSWGFFTIEQEMDHKAFSSFPGLNYLKVVIPKFGTRLKVYI